MAKLLREPSMAGHLGRTGIGISGVNRHQIKRDSVQGRAFLGQQQLVAAFAHQRMPEQILKLSAHHRPRG